ncbi:MAG: hypothetical protein ACLGGV_00560 [Bacteroidia bacterium]
MGIKKPKSETKESILKYSIKIGLQANNVFVLNSLKSMSDVSKKTNIPAVRIYNSNKEFLGIISKDTNSCTGSAEDIIAQLNKETFYPVIDTLTLDAELKMFSLIGEQTNNDEYDFYVTIYFAKWAGKLNKKIVEWEKAAQNNPNAKIKVIKLNTDLQEEWDVKLRMSKPQAEK